jgi:hypothetical protein
MTEQTDAQRTAPKTSQPPPPLAGRGSGSLPVRLVGALAAFIVAAMLGILALGTFQPPDPNLGYSIQGANSFALVFAIALVLAFVVYALLEYQQTGGIASISSQFDTRTIALMPIAIGFNIVLGQAVGTALKIPIYLDSIGTILVGALAGPIPGALTGFLANMLWQYVVPPPFHNDYIAAFSIVAAVIGLLAGVFGRWGWLRPRRDRPFLELILGGAVALVLILGLAYVAFLGYVYVLGSPNLTPESTVTFYGIPLFVILGYLAILLVGGTVVGLLAALFIRRDLTAAYVVVAGVVTGIVAAAISAPISANVFGGITGAGTDFLVAAFRQAGADIQSATLGQGLISDPIDKVMTFFVVYLILSAMARRTKARFPQGERLIEPPPAMESTGGTTA